MLIAILTTMISSHFTLPSMRSYSPFYALAILLCVFISIPIVISEVVSGNQFCENDFQCNFYCDFRIHICSNSFIELGKSCPDSTNRINPKQCGYKGYCNSSNECSEKKLNNGVCSDHFECRSGFCNFNSDSCTENPYLTAVNIGNIETLLIILIFVLVVLVLVLFWTQAQILNEFKLIRQQKIQIKKND